MLINQWIPGLFSDMGIYNMSNSLVSSLYPSRSLQCRGLLYRVIYMYIYTCLYAKEQNTSQRSLPPTYIHVYIHWLVVWNNMFVFSIQLGMSSSQLTFTHIFQRGGSTTNQYIHRKNSVIIYIYMYMYTHIYIYIHMIYIYIYTYAYIYI